MGQGLRKPVKSIVVKRHPGKLFRVGFAEMNGWRASMEDAHIVFAQETWGFFGVFDGHGGSQCSSFVAKRMTEEIAKGAPEDDAAMRSLVMQLDKEFLDTNQPSGSTGTFAIIHPDSADGRFRLRVGNVGDSRVLLGRADGTIVEGPGTDGGLTTDHKPDHPDERARIERTGGTVEFVQGVPRVNGDLAVSRAFGDEQHKKSGPTLAEQPVSADPEFTDITCDSSDFLMLVCDGISEGNFPNKEVVQLAAEELRRGGERPDPGAAATAICHMALEKGSMDNLSCMIVLFGGGEIPGPEKALLPGQFLPDTPFKNAYAAMAEHVGLSLAEAIEMRYDLVKKQIADAAANGDASSTDATARDASLSELGEEIAAFGDGPPETMPSASAERIQWFNTWIQEHCSNDEEDPMQSIQMTPQLLEMARSRGLIPEPESEAAEAREVRVGPAELVRQAIEGTPALKWGPGIEALCGTQGHLCREDASDSTAEVAFNGEDKRIKAWLPLSTLTDVMTEVCALDELRPAVEAHSALKWHDRLADTCGKSGIVLKVDSDGTSNVRFRSLNGMEVWLPSECLSEAEAKGHVDSVEPEKEPVEDPSNKRQRTSE